MLSHICSRWEVRLQVNLALFDAAYDKINRGTLRCYGYFFGIEWVLNELVLVFPFYINPIFYLLILQDERSISIVLTRFGDIIRGHGLDYTTRRIDSRNPSLGWTQRMGQVAKIADRSSNDMGIGRSRQ